jgi:hypothetical protein
MNISPEASPVLRRAAAVGLLLLLMIATSKVILLPTFDFVFDSDPGLVEKRRTLAAVAGRIGMIPRIHMQLNALTKQLQMTGVLWPRKAPPELSAEVQARLRSTMLGSGGTVQTTAGLPTIIDHGLLKIPVRMIASGNIECLAKLLKALGGTEPMLFIDTLKLQSGNVTRDAQEPQISVEIEVAGYGLTSQ